MNSAISGKLGLQVADQLNPRTSISRGQLLMYNLDSCHGDYCEDKPPDEG